MIMGQDFAQDGDLAMQWYIDYDQFTSEDGEYDELFQHKMVNYEMVSQILKRISVFLEDECVDSS
ncbi:MAG: hypothetical protein V8Q88_00445 [Christensenellales bacterium]